MAEDKPKTEDPQASEEEEKQTEEKPAEKSAAPTPQTPTLLDQARAVNEEKAKLLDREERLITRKEKMMAEELVGGKGESIPEKKEETNVEYSDRVMRGDFQFDE